MRLIDQQFLLTPFYGSRRMTACLERSGETVNRKRVQRLMAKMGMEALFPRLRTTTAAPDARVYPYLLRDRELTHADEVWSSDITYVPMRRGFMYLTAVIDWYSRYVLSWRLSNTLEGRFCLEALDEALSRARKLSNIFLDAQKRTAVLFSTRTSLQSDGIVPGSYPVGRLAWGCRPRGNLPP
jgi:putative transposase